MDKYEKLQRDQELMADFRACVKHRNGIQSDFYQFYLARKFDIGVVERMQRLGLYSLWIWALLFILFPHRETVLCCLLHVSLVVHWDNWWGNVFEGHQRFDYFSRKELKKEFGDSWDDGPLF